MFADHRWEDPVPLPSQEVAVALTVFDTANLRMQLATEVLDERNRGTLDRVATAISVLDLNHDDSFLLLLRLTRGVIAYKLKLRQAAASLFGIPPDAVDMTVEPCGRGLEWTAWDSVADHDRAANA